MRTEIVPASGDNGHRADPIPRALLRHREEFVKFVLAKADPWHREHLTRLYEFWREANEQHFGGKMHEPYILLNETTVPNCYGCCAQISGFGGRSEIRIRPSLVRGTHPHMSTYVGGRRYALFGSQEGRIRFVEDVLLHEMIHQWQQEVTGNREESYHGHGPDCRDKANEIGAKLGFGSVRYNKKRGKNKDLPSCTQWPHNVRPADYYLGAYRPTRKPAATKELRAAWLRAPEEARRKFLKWASQRK